MWSWPYWTPWATRCPNVRRPSVEASPIPPTKRHSSSRWLCSSSPTSHSSCLSTTSAAWSARRWLAGSLWASTALGRKNCPTGLRWKSPKDSRSATGTVCWSPNSRSDMSGVTAQPLCSHRGTRSSHIKSGDGWKLGSAHLNRGRHCISWHFHPINLIYVLKLTQAFCSASSKRHLGLAIRLYVYFMHSIVSKYCHSENKNMKVDLGEIRQSVICECYTKSLV